MRTGIDYIGTSAGAVIYNDEGKLFLAQRGPGARDDVGKWEFPGGSTKHFETRKEAVMRNVLDKYALSIDVGEILGVYDVIDKEVGDHWISTTYLCQHIAGEPNIIFPTKCQTVGWFTLDQVRTLDLSRISQLNLNDLLTSREMSHSEYRG
jgi:8-oxo-dGTP diphosphatase